MAGLSYATMVVEAGQKSGSLITAELTKKYKRRLFAVPGPLTSVLSKGTVQLIKEGAEIVTGAKDLLVGYDIASFSPSRGFVQSLELCGLEQSIVKKLQEEPMGIDTLTRSVKTSASEIATALSFMQIKGLVFEEGGKYYVD